MSAWGRSSSSDGGGLSRGGQGRISSRGRDGEQRNRESGGRDGSEGLGEGVGVMGYVHRVVGSGGDGRAVIDRSLSALARTAARSREGEGGGTLKGIRHPLNSHASAFHLSRFRPIILLPPSTFPPPVKASHNSPPSLNPSYRSQSFPPSLPHSLHRSFPNLPSSSLFLIP
jgi:hypothetical protein